MGGDQKRLRFLLVEDDLSVLRAVRRRLSVHGEVVTTQTILGAGELLQSEWPIDAALLDFDLGCGTALELLDAWPWHFGAMGVLVYTAHQDPKISTAVQQRRVQFAQKPLEEENYVALARTASEMSVERAVLRELVRANLKDEALEMMLVSLSTPSRGAAEAELNSGLRRLKKVIEKSLFELTAHSIEELRRRIVEHGTTPLLARIRADRGRRLRYSGVRLRDGTVSHELPNGGKRGGNDV